MVRARILAGAATFVVACALPSAASAQIGPCPTIQPPPCIITDPSKIAQTVVELKHKRDELQNTISQVKEFTSLQGVLGMVGGDKAANQPIISIVKAVNSGPKITVSEAANQLDSALRGNGQSQDSRGTAKSEDRLRARAAAGEGYATALAIKARVSDFDANYNDLFRRLSARQEELQTSKPVEVSQAEQLKMCRSMGKGQFTQWSQRYLGTGIGGKGSATVEEDWELHNASRILFINALLLKREVDAGRLQLRAMTSIDVGNREAGARIRRSEAAPAAPSVQLPRHNIDLGQLMNTVGQLLALKNAADTVGGLINGIRGARDTQAEYQQMAAAKASTQKAVEDLAAAEARRKGVSAQSLLSVANQVMQRYDRTVWDDPSKIDAARNAANRAKASLDGMVSGDVSDQWDNLLERRAEAFKQEAFFRTIATEAKTGESTAIAALKDYNQSIGIDASNAQALQQKIAELEAKVAELSQSLSSAPADIISIRDRIISSASATASADEVAPSATGQRPLDRKQISKL